MAGDDFDCEAYGPKGREAGACASSRSWASEPLAPDCRDWTAGQLMTCIARALEAHDIEAVPHLITLLAFKDAHLAGTLYESMLAVIDAAR